MFAGMIIIAANAGGAWSPIGDVTTIMLWIGGTGYSLEYYYFYHYSIISMFDRSNDLYFIPFKRKYYKTKSRRIK